MNDEKSPAALPLGIIWLIVAGFAVVAAAIWIDECFDLPHRLFGTPSTAMNLHEAAFESSFVIILGAMVVFFARRLMRRIAHLESMLPICSFCKKIREPGADPEKQESWKPVERYINARTGTQFSHGLCPECMMKHYGALFDEEEKTS